MKKLLFAMMALGLAFFTACTEQESEPMVEENEEVVTDAAGDAVEVVEETVEEVSDEADDAM